MNLIPHLDLAGHGLLSLPNPAKGFFIVGGYGADHDAGRWWDAMLRLEDTIGFAIPADIEGAMLRNHHQLMDNPDGLLMNHLENPHIPAAAKRINPHNFREGLLALWALVRYRRSVWALTMARRLTATIDRCLQSDGRFAFDQLKCAQSMPLTNDRHHLEIRRGDWFDSTATTGRALEVLVWLYEATGEADFFALATRLAEHHLAFTLGEDGAVRDEIIAPVNFGHTHSYLGTLRGLLCYGLSTGDRQYVDRVAATFRNGVKRQIVKESGWAAHDLGEQTPGANGQLCNEMGSTSDATQLALWLAVQAGHDDLLDDVERWVRARFIPAQLTAEEARQADPDLSTVVRRQGGWGCYAVAHGTKDSTPDVFAAALHALCDVYNNICSETETALRINLHFDFEDDRLAVTSARHDGGHLAVRVKQAAAGWELAIRVPGWVPAADVQLTVDGEPVAVDHRGGFARLAADRLTGHSLIEMRYPLPERSTDEELPTGHRYRLAWQADEIIGCDPRDEVTPFHPPLAGT